MLQVSTRSYLEYPIGKEATKGYPRLAIHTILLMVKSLTRNNSIELTGLSIFFHSLVNDRLSLIFCRPNEIEKRSEVLSRLTY